MSEITLTSKPVEVSQPWLLEGVEVPAFADGADLIERLKKIYTLRVGERPVVRSLRELYKLKKKKLPAEVGVLKGEVYLITHAIGVNASEKPNSIERLSYRASFEGYGSTIEMFPNTRHVKRIDLGWTFEAGISAEGYAKTPELVGKIAKEIINIGAGAELKLATSANIVGDISISIRSPVIQAVGQSSSSTIWQFERDKNSLVGDQIMVQTVVIPREQKKVRYNLQGFAMIDLGLFQRSVSIETEPITVELDL